MSIVAGVDFASLEEAIKRSNTLIDELRAQRKELLAALHEMERSGVLDSGMSAALARQARAAIARAEGAQQARGTVGRPAGAPK